MTTPREPLLVRITTGVESRRDRLVDFYNRRARGPLRLVLGLGLGIAKRYQRWIWNRFARNKAGRYTGKRIAATLLMTAFLLWLIPSMLLTVWQAGLMATTWKDEVVFLTSAEEVDPLSEVHSIRGCRAIPCRESDAIYYRVRSSWMHDGYALLKRGHMFYPEEVAGVVAPGVNRCEVTSYGIRIKALMRGWGIYPEMLDAVCTPYQTETGQAMQADPTL